MKFFRTALAALFTALFLILGAGCDPQTVIPPAIRPEDPESKPKTEYELFSEKFAAASTGKWSSAGGTHTVTFSNGSLTLDAETRVSVCTPETWPAVTLKGTRWHVDGTDTGIALTSTAASERIVVVIYDTEGIYVRLSSGAMFYFHDGRTLDVGCFRFEKALNPSLADDVICTVEGTTISGDVGRIFMGTELIPTFGSRGEMGIAGRTQSLMSSVSSVTFTGNDLQLWLAKGSGKLSYTVSLEYASASVTVPTLRINTKGQGAPTSKENYITVDLTIEDPDLLYGSVASETVVTEIRGRGNTTWGMDKKPYKLKLDKKKRLLGMSDNKHWTLLANYSDKSLLRNSLAFKIGELTGMEWLPRWVPVEVYMDGRYEGQYMLTEQIRTGDERIEMELADATDNSGEAVTGGYLFCIDEKDFDPGYGTPKVGFWHRNASGSQFPVAFDEPEDPTTQQIAYAKAMFKEIEDAIYHSSFTEFSKVIDVESVIDYFFVNELAKNPDGNMRLSTYIAKPRGGKLYFPTVWDFDISFGNCNYADNNNQMGPNDGGFWNPSGGWPTRDAVWIRQMFRNREFCDLVAVRWNELKPQLAGLEPFIREWAAHIEESQRRNFERWRILGVEVWPNWNARSRTTYKAEVDFLVDFINRRVAWLDREINAGRHRL